MNKGPTLLRTLRKYECVGWGLGVLHLACYCAFINLYKYSCKSLHTYMHIHMHNVIVKALF